MPAFLVRVSRWNRVVHADIYRPSTTETNWRPWEWNSQSRHIGEPRLLLFFVRDSRKRIPWRRRRRIVRVQAGFHRRGPSPSSREILGEPSSFHQNTTQSLERKPRDFDIRTSARTGVSVRPPKGEVQVKVASRRKDWKRFSMRGASVIRWRKRRIVEATGECQNSSPRDRWSFLVEGVQEEGWRTERIEERGQRKASRFSPSGDMSWAQLRRLTELGIPVRRRAKTGTSVLHTI